MNFAMLTYVVILLLCVIVEVVNPKDAKEAAKRLVESGVCHYYDMCVYIVYFVHVFNSRVSCLCICISAVT